LAIETHETLAGKPRPRNNITLLVFVAIAAAIVLGILDPSLALKMKPLGDLFIKLIRMTIGPIVFLCVATGVAHIGDLRKVGRIGFKALIYFELVTTLALTMQPTRLRVRRFHFSSSLWVPFLITFWAHL